MSSTRWERVQEERREKAKEVMVLLQKEMRVILRTSMAGVPHLVVDLSDGSMASVVWFTQKPTFRVFHPYGVTDSDGKWAPQDKFDCLTPEEVVARLKVLDVELVGRLKTLA